jgi:hypothetical protein
MRIRDHPEKLKQDVVERLSNSFGLSRRAQDHDG